LKLILEEAMEIVIENREEQKLDGTIQDVRDGVKELYLLRAHVLSTQCWVRVHFLENRNMELSSRWNHCVNI
jgi:hypothetical protein